MTLKADELRRGLRDYRRRAVMIDEAVTGGTEAVEAAVQLLNDKHEGVRWSAIRILSEIGDRSAVIPLVSLMERGRNAVEAAGALRAITGEEYGEDAETWRRWASQDPGLGAEIARGRLSDEELLAVAVEDLPVALTGADGEYTAEVSLPEGRTQRVWISFAPRDPAGEPIVQLCTACGDVDESRYEWALKLNMSIPYGAVGIARLGERLCFAMVDAYLRATVGPEEIAKSLMSLATEGDRIEKSLASADQF